MHSVEKYILEVWKVAWIHYQLLRYIRIPISKPFNPNPDILRVNYNLSLMGWISWMKYSERLIENAFYANSKWTLVMKAGQFKKRF